MIYFIKSPDGPIKIGTTIRLSARLKQLVAEYGQGLEVLAVTEGDRGGEQELHRRFEHLNVVNEWFEPGDDLVGFIVREGRPWDGTDEVPAESDSRVMVIALKGSPEFRDWLADASKKVRIPASNIVEVALAKWATENGVPEPPQR